MTRRYAETMVPVPERYEEWAYEYRIGYNDGLTVKPYTFSPAMKGEFGFERKEAYRAGRRAGARVKRRSAREGDNA